MRQNLEASSQCNFHLFICFLLFYILDEYLVEKRFEFSVNCNNKHDSIGPTYPYPLELW